MAVEFLKDIGFRLSSSGRSMIVSTMSLSKLGTSLSDRQFKAMAAAIDNYLDEIAGRPKLSNRINHITPAIPQHPISDVAYKFTDDEGARYWAAGSIKLNPLVTYVAIKNDGLRDVREGMGLVQLFGKERAMVIQSASGFNTRLICASSDARRSERSYRHSRFGSRLIKISRLQEFGAKIAKLAGASHHKIRDVTYSDSKAVKGQSLFPDWFAQNNRAGDMHMETLEAIADQHLDELIGVTEAASIFTKPVSYQLERERRLMFGFLDDAVDPIVIDDKALREHIEVLT
jgi:hypothetical protein